MSKIDRDVTDFIESWLEEGGVLAGGWLRDTILGYPVNDVDIFFTFEQNIGLPRDPSYWNTKDTPADDYAVPNIHKVLEGKMPIGRTDTVGSHIVLESGVDINDHIKTFDHSLAMIYQTDALAPVMSPMFKHSIETGICYWTATANARDVARRERLARKLNGFEHRVISALEWADLEAEARRGVGYEERR